MEYYAYSSRILCPFHGMLQVLATQGGIAESTDGFHWKLYVADESIISHTGLSEVRYGSWDANNGCSRSKIRGTAPSELIEETGLRLVRLLEAYAHEVPFKPADRFEFWLLDEGQQPLALLETTVERPTGIITSTPQWHPGAAAKQDFTSDHGDVFNLTDLLQREAGPRLQGVWIERTADGLGIAEGDRTLAADELPTLFIRRDWPDPSESALVRDFLAWQAPWLLQLHHLDTTTRTWLEQAAWQRPAETNKVFRLFPQILDPQGLTATRVKSRFLSGQVSPTSPEPFYPFFNE